MLFDVVKADGFTDPRVCVVTGDIADPQAISDAIDADTASIFHLAAVVSSPVSYTHLDVYQRQLQRPR